MAQFFDRQDANNPRNGLIVRDEQEIQQILDASTGRPRFFAEIIGDNGFKLLIGIGGEVGCVQYSPTDGRTPYLMALSKENSADIGYEEFLIGGEASQVPRRFCMPRDAVAQIAKYFVRTGNRNPDVAWEEI